MRNIDEILNYSDDEWHEMQRTQAEREKYESALSELSALHAAVADRDAAIDAAEREYIETLELAVREVDKAFALGALAYTHKRKSDDEQYHRSNTALTNAMRAIRARNETKEE